MGISGAFYVGPDGEVEQDLEQLCVDVQAHLTAAITQYVISQPQSEAAIEVVLPHLCRCSWCRNMLHETLALCGREASDPAYSLLEEAEEWARWEAAGRHATEAARQSLRAQGANIIYARDGVLWEERPDGTLHRRGEVSSQEASSQ